MPGHVLVVDDIPKTQTGKVQRARVAAALAPRLRTEFASPGTALEGTLAAIWTDVLGRGRVGIHDNFFRPGRQPCSCCRCRSGSGRRSAARCP